MTRRRTLKMLLATAVASWGLALAPEGADAQVVVRTVNVNCNVAGQTIGVALKRQVVGGGLLVRITGTCNEHVDILYDDVTLRGVAAGATIHGPTTADATVSIDGAKRIGIESLTITGGNDGVSAVRGASFTMENVTVQGAARLGVVASYGSQGFLDSCIVRQSGSNGVTAANTSTIVITNSTVQQNSTGIVAVRASHVRVGQNFSGTILGPVVVQNNTSNGLTISETAAAIVVSTTIQNNGGNGIFVGRGAHAEIGIGSFNQVGNVSVLNNVSTGVYVEGGSIGIVGTTISGNSFGLSLQNNGNGRIGVLPDTSGYRGNTISGNQASGLTLSDGSAALIGGTAIRGNGTTAAVGSRWGVQVVRASARFVGQNVIENHTDSGILVFQGAALSMGSPFGNLDPTGNIIRNNGIGIEAATQRFGVQLFAGATGLIINTLLTGNSAGNVALGLGSSLDLRASTVSNALVAPGGTAAGTPGISVGTHGTARLATGALVDGNPGDGVQLFSGASLEFRNDTPVTISNNGGFPINCFGTEASIAVPVTGAAVPIFTGNAAGNAPAGGCTGF